MQQNTIIIGRERELALLDKMLSSKQAEFLAVYGRRRVGKTFLISTYFKDKANYFEFTGIKDADLKTQLKSFGRALTAASIQNKIPVLCNNWFEALASLRQYVENIPSQQRVVIFFDELPWIATAKSNFLPALDNFWNCYLSRRENVSLIVCGSAASWMIDNILANTGGLYGRLTQKIC